MPGLARILIIGGGLALGLAAAGVAAMLDRDRMIKRSRKYKVVHRYTPRSDRRRASRPARDWS
ncbi:MAG: hypothetical protein GY839_17970 [candidate division Zixibacteria bacterium]|nr:hypothetical protein [candidate division Zixibacteria bacterium]